MRRTRLPMGPGQHPLPANWLNVPVSVYVIGCGGTGAQVVTKLARLHLALRALGHPAGLTVRVFDGDRVSEANVGRQLYSVSDIGLYKADVMVHRLNAFYGLNWEAITATYPLAAKQSTPDITITCVDTAKARREIAAHMICNANRKTYWLDCGNAQETGQVFLTRGWEDEQFLSIGMGNTGDPLPMLRDVLPELFDEALPEDDRPSCSLAESLEHQGLFINDEIATWAVRLLEMWFRQGHLSVHGYWINQGAGYVHPVPVPASKPPRKRPTGAKA